MYWFLFLHNLLCQLLFGGDAPEWLLRLHGLFGWG